MVKNINEIFFSVSPVFLREGREGDVVPKKLFGVFFSFVRNA